MKKIFSPFIKLWNWIKETAWIQPLLIVGIVFGIIFSISPIVKACSTEDTNAEYDFYATREVSLENIFTDVDNCEAVNLLSDIYEAELSFDENTKTYDQEKVAKLPNGGKFMLMFYSKDCTACKNNVEAFEYLTENWGSGAFIPEDDSDKFELITINTLDEVKNEKDEDEVAFPELLLTVPEFFETAGAEVRNSPYYNNNHVDEVNLGKFTDQSQDAFPVPTMLLIDFTSENARGYQTLMFTIPGKDNGTGAAAKAMTLIDCWNNAEDFGEKK